MKNVHVDNNKTTFAQNAQYNQGNIYGVGMSNRAVTTVDSASTFNNNEVVAYDGNNANVYGTALYNGAVGGWAATADITVTGPGKDAASGNFVGNKVTINGAGDVSGGAIANRGIMELTNSVIANTVINITNGGTVKGGGINTDDGDLNLVSDTISNNTIAITGTNFSGSVYDDSEAYVYGGGLFSKGSAFDAYNVALNRNKSQINGKFYYVRGNGGGAYFDNVINSQINIGTINVDYNEMSYGTTAGEHQAGGVTFEGGGLYIDGEGGKFTLANSSVSHNSMQVGVGGKNPINPKVYYTDMMGGGIFSTRSSLTLNDVDILGNTISSNAETIINCDGSDLMSVGGGGIYASDWTYGDTSLTANHLNVNNNTVYHLHYSNDTVYNYDNKRSFDVGGGGMDVSLKNINLTDFSVKDNKVSFDMDVKHPEAHTDRIAMYGGGMRLSTHGGTTLTDGQITGNELNFTSVRANKGGIRTWGDKYIYLAGGGLHQQGKGLDSQGGGPLTIGTTDPAASPFIVSENSIKAVNHSTVKENYEVIGGGISIDASGGKIKPTITNTEIKDNLISIEIDNLANDDWGYLYAKGGGIAMYMDYDGGEGSEVDNAVITNSKITGNIAKIIANNEQSATVQGGGLYWDSEGYLQVHNDTTGDNEDVPNSLTLNNVNINNNSVVSKSVTSANGSGGGLYLTSKYAYDKTIDITGGLAQDGSKITTIDGNTVNAENLAQRGSVSAHGGGLYYETSLTDYNKDADRHLKIENLKSISGNKAIANAMHLQSRAQAHGGGLFINNVKDDNEATKVIIKNVEEISNNEAIANAESSPVHHSEDYEYKGQTYHEEWWDNYSEAKGGGLYADRSVVDIINTSFEDNVAKATYKPSMTVHDSDFSYGGAIYAKDSVINIIADSEYKNIYFNGNEASQGSDIYLENSTLNLRPGDGLVAPTNGNKIIFTGQIAGDAYSVINQGSEEKRNLHGTVILGGDGTQFWGKYKLYDGTMAFGFASEEPIRYTFKDLWLDGGTISLWDNDIAGDVVVIDKLTGMYSSSDPTDLYVDFNARTGEMDKLTVNSVDTLLEISPKINIKAINITEDGGRTFADYLDGAARNQVETLDSTHQITAVTETMKYVFTPDNNVHGRLWIIAETGMTLAEAIHEEENRNITSYSFTNAGDYVTEQGLGGLVYNDDGARDFTIFGNGHDLDGAEFNGVQLGDNQTLTLHNVTTMKNFSGAAITNTFSGNDTATKGVVNVVNSSFADNGQDIVNDAIVNLQSGTINLASGIQDVAGNGSMGTTNIGGANVILGDNATIKQANLNISSGSLTSKASALIASITNGAKLILTGGNLASAISGTGTTEIAGAVTNTDDKAIANAVTVRENASLSTSATTLGAAVTNSGTVNLTGGTLSNAITGGTITISGDTTSSANNLIGSITNAESTLTLAGGTLSQAISGNGTTKVSESLALVNGASVAGTLNVNEGLLDLATDDVALTYNIGTLTGTTGTLKLDVDLTGNTPVSDAINITTGGNNIALTINDIAVNGTLGNFTVDVLKGQTDGATISLAQAVSDQFNYTGNWTDRQESDALTQTATWDDTFSSRTWEERNVNTISIVDGTKINYTETTEKQNEQVTTGDTIALLTQATQFGTGERKYTTDSATKTHNATADFGNVTAGTLTIKGATDGTNTSTINLNEKAGFVVGEGATVNLDTVKITGAKAEAGSLVNNSTGTVNLTKVTTGVNASDIITNSSTLNVTDSTLKTGITGTGTTKVTGNNIISRISQKVVSIVSGAKLEATSIAATDGISNTGELTISGDGTNTSAITGDGKLIVNADIANSGDIENSVTVNAGKSLTSSADKIKNTVANSGTYNVSGGTIAKDVTGNGSTVIAGDVINNASISNAVTISADNSLTSSANNITGTVTNAGTYNITGGTISTVISGNGALNITGDVVNNAVNTMTGAVSVAAGKTLTLGANTNNMFGSASALTLNNGTTLNLQNGTTTATAINKLVLADGANINTMTKWGDTLNGALAGTTGGITVTSVDVKGSVAEAGAPAQSYVMSTTLANNIALAADLSIKNVGDTTFNTLTYNSATGSLSGVKSKLVDAIQNTDVGGRTTYAMTGNETGGGKILEGTLKIQGAGNTITSDATATASDTIQVGNGTVGGADLIMEDVNLGAIKTNGAEGAVVVKGGNNLEFKAKLGDVSIDGSDNGTGIYLEKDATLGAATVTLNAEGGDINITDDIRSSSKDNTVTFAGSQEINFSGTFDPATANVNTTVNRTGGYDETITYNINGGGILKYANDSILWDPAHHTALTMNTINFAGGALDTRNGVVTDFNLANMSLTGTSKFYADVDLANQTMDKFTVTNPVTGTGYLNVAGLNLISDAAEVNTAINFTSNPVLMAATSYTGAQGITALSPIYKYNVGYDKTTGDFNFARYNSGGYGDFNPSILAAPIAAQFGGYLSQLQSYDEAFYNMDMYMLMTKEQRQALKFKNQYAAADGGLLYDSSLARQERAEGWFRPYATFEKVGLKNGPRVENQAYGTYMGGESKLYDLGHGWDGMFGAYVGYNGSHQNYNGVSIYQNGGTLGLTGMAYKGNFFTGLTINAGASVAEASTIYGNDDFTMLMAGIASKTGYNWELANGKFIIQPSMLMSYSFVNTFDTRNSAGVRLDSDPLHAIQLQPELKFIGNLKNGWQPYASVAMVWNIMDDTKFKANDVALPEMSVKPYVKYGLGVRKTWGERFTGFFQTYLTNGGRNGVGLQAGFTWALGKDPSKTSDSNLNKTPELKKTQMTLSSNKNK